MVRRAGRSGRATIRYLVVAVLLVHAIHMLPRTGLIEAVRAPHTGLSTGADAGHDGAPLAAGSGWCRVEVAGTPIPTTGCGTAAVAVVRPAAAPIDRRSIAAPPVVRPIGPDRAWLQVFLI